jgi:sugar phosphate isomerase/epimerase
MKLGFVSAILSELSLDEVFAFAAKTGYSSVEVMCWPPGKAERRYSGVTHIDVTNLDGPAVLDLAARHGVAISGLGYYPNPLASDRDESEAAVAHLHRLIDASSDLGINLVNSFVGRDPALSVEANWPRFI